MKYADDIKLFFLVYTEVSGKFLQSIWSIGRIRQFGGRHTEMEEVHVE